MNPLIHDVAIVGGGAAGLSAAVALARSLRSVVVVDAGNPRNAPASGAHNVLGHEGINPMELLAAGRREAQSYGADIRHDRAVTARRTDEGFEVSLASGGTINARQLLIATGLVDELPEIPGIREFWGTSVLHCPYCHGWEVRGQRIGVLGAGASSVHQALLFRQLSNDVTLFVHRMPDPGTEAWEQLAALDIRIVKGTVDRLRDKNGVLTAVILEDGRDVPVDALVVAPRLLARAELYEQLGGTLAENPMGTFIATDRTGRTDLPGVWAAGNVSDLSAMIVAASAAGIAAGTIINAELVMEKAQAH